jgi:hypothetical protein
VKAAPMADRSHFLDSSTERALMRHNELVA